MASFLPSSIQKRLLRYVLLRSGLLDTQELDLESLDITLGRQNTVELRNVRLQVQKLSSLLELPPELRLQTATVLRLKLNVPADLFHGSVTAEAQGIECSLALEPPAQEKSTDESQSRSFESTKGPRHRKTHRRIGRSPPYDPGGLADDDGVPTTQDLARSFLIEEPREEIHQLEEKYRSQSRHMRESVRNDIGEDDGLGTGTAPGLPGFLAGFLQGIFDRFRLNIRDVTARLAVPISSDTSSAARDTASEPGRTISVILKVESVDVGAAGDSISGTHQTSHGPRRSIVIQNVRVLLAGLKTPGDGGWTGMAAHSKNSIDAAADLPQAVVSSSRLRSPIDKYTTEYNTPDLHAAPFSDTILAGGLPTPKPTAVAHGSPEQLVEPPDPFDIQPGEDNLAWNVRRTETGSSTSDVWSGSDQASDLEASISADQYLSGSSRNFTTSHRGHESPVLARSDPATSSPDLGFGSGALSDREEHSSSALSHPNASASLSESRHFTTDVEDSEHEDNDVDPLAESRLYTDEEAQSLYMSAHSSGFGRSTFHDDSPGYRPAEAKHSAPHSISDSTDTIPGPTLVPAAAETSSPSTSLSGDDAGIHTRSDEFTNAPSAGPTGLQGTETLAEPVEQYQILLVDKIDICLVSNIPNAADIEETQQAKRAAYEPARGRTGSSSHQYMPGSFSVYADLSASVRFDDPNTRSTLSLTQNVSGDDDSPSSLEVRVCGIYLALEFGMLDEYLRLAKFFGTLTKSATKPSAKPELEICEDAQLQQSKRVSVERFRFDLVQSAKQHWNVVKLFDCDTSDSKSSSPTSLVGLEIADLNVQLAPPDRPIDWALQIRTLRITVGEQHVLSFSDRLQSSRRSLVTSDCDVSVQASTSSTVTSRKLIHFIVQTRQIDVAFDFGKFAETFDSYGGLSGLIEISSSFTSTEPSPRSPSIPAKKGVRFQDTSPEPEAGGSEIKVNARFEGLAALIRANSGSMKLVTSSIKTVIRPEFMAATIDNVQLLGPVMSRPDALKPVEVVINNFRFEYLFHPTDTDLERLLSLLTPSKNKYESDDDILLDTLLRQRRKGAVVRLTLASVRTRIPDWDFIAPLQAFADEMASLSAVTKYLPEDERPGLLSLVRVQEVQADIPVNPTFGSAGILLRDCNVAHIGLPSLLAFAIGTVKISRQGSADLVHALMPISPNEDLPMIMARMIGDEVEPTLRLKLFNICVEYSVPIFLALTEFAENVAAEQVIDLAASAMVDLTATVADLAISPTSTTSFSSKPAKKLAVDVLFHQCVVGLQPTGLSSKALLVFDNAKITTVVPPKEIIKASCELRKASIYVADTVEALSDAADAARIGLGQRLPQSLNRMGYVSVCSLMAARIDIEIVDHPGNSSKSVEVDVRNDLLLMETCADSTRTLIQTLGALAPPTPPTKEPKFRTEAMTMDGMVSSFTGDAYEKPVSPPSTIFDTDTALPLSEEDLLNASMSESMYGGFGDLEDPENDLMLEGDRPMETAESLLEEDPFEFPDNPNTAKLSNRDLTKDLNRQLAAGRAQRSNPKPWFLPPEQIDRLPGESTVLGAGHRFNTPNTKQRSVAEMQMRDPLPLKLRLREVHIIWNLYDGYDWQGTRQAISQAVEEVESRAEERRLKRQTAPDPEDEESIIGDCLFNSIYIGVPANKDAQDLRRQINRGIDDLASETESYATSGVSKPTNLSGGNSQRGRRAPRRLKLERSRAHKVAFELKGVSADILVFAPGSGEAQNSLDVRVRDFEIFDNLPSSTWRKFLTSWHKDGSEREIAKPMVHLEMTTIRPTLELSATELLLCVTITPLRLHVDQDALDFITRFFEFKDSSSPPPSSADPPFIQRLEIHTVDFALDYKPKRVDYAGLRSGRYTEFKNFFILDSAPIKLKHTILYGLTGFDNLNDTLNDIWMPDIKRNQLPSVLSGLAGVSPLVSLTAGIADVVAVPIREYRKDGRIVRSIQKGAAHLARNTTSEVARFGARVAVGTHNALLGAEGLLAPYPSAQQQQQQQQQGREQDPDDVRAVVSAYANQPLGVMQGLRSARASLERDLLTARDAIIAVQGEVLEGSNAGAAARAVVRHGPTILLRPVIGATRAVGQTLMGVGNAVDAGNRRRVEDKYKQR